ncbi:putative membrane protein YqjE [Algisphaera agarilytica]|uniref:Putative membrane protein YqjE n=2 Tax=Algisphaera agarilytica TaxID=1385975 RepID=A0A7X0H979_9BACT|nr:putative membrane protein YqjE [Algisphaera agarilytica]
MAQFARYTAIVGRVRQFHREYLNAYAKLQHCAPDERPLLQGICAELEQQAHGVLRLACMIRSALMFLVVAVICMIVTSLLIGLELVWPRVGAGLGLAVFVSGLVMMLVGMGYVFAEVRISLRLVQHEHAELERRAAVGVSYSGMSDSNSEAEA